jgi:CheY-like chemotaxis protein
MEAVGTLAGGIAHDFNNILQVISGNAFLKGQRESGRGEHSPELVNIIEAVEQAANLTQGLLAFSRRQSLDCHPLNLNDLIRRSAGLGRRLVEESVSITIDLCPDTLTVIADAGLIQQVFFNLITNARDAMNASGSITVRTVLETVGKTFPPRGLSLPTVPPPGNYAVFCVSDTAAGIPHEIMGKIFDPFFTTKEKGKGTGLGLAMIHGTITQHQGFIVVDSRPDKGTTFSIYLHQYEGVGHERSLSETPDEALHQQREHTILVAEDDTSVRDLLVMALSSSGYQVLVAENGKEAVEVFRTHQDSVSLILMDIVMPVMNGREALERIRELQPGIACLFISGYGAEILDSHDDALNGTAIRKPFKLPDLLNKVYALLEAV